MAAIPGPADDGGSNPRRTGGENPETVTIRCRLDGPLVVELPAVGAAGEQSGPIRLRVTDHLGQEFALPTHKRAVALCRCGRTKSRPFCDGSHKAVGFEAADLADGGPPPGMDANLPDDCPEPVPGGTIMSSAQALTVTESVLRKTLTSGCAALKGRRRVPNDMDWPRKPLYG
jgi:CDGSH-type Zn-finger protein